MAKLKTCAFTLAGEKMFGAKDENDTYYVAVTEIDALFGNARTGDFTRRKLETKSLQAALGAVVHPAKMRIGRSMRSFIPVHAFTALILNLAIEEQSTMAMALLQATLAESIQRRVDNELGEGKTEPDYERATKEIYQRLRDEHKIQYKPYVTNWTKLDAPRCHPSFYGKRTNEIKKACGFDTLVSVNEMTTGQLMQWNTIEVRYDSFRRAGLNHKQALAEIASV